MRSRRPLANSMPKSGPTSNGAYSTTGKPKILSTSRLVACVEVVELVPFSFQNRDAL